MNATTFLNILAASVGFAAALFLCLGTARLKNKSIFELAGTYWNFNGSLAESLSAQRADYISGAVLLFISFALQFSANLVPEKTDFLKSFWNSLATIAIVVTLLVVLALVLRALLVRSSKLYVAEQVQKKGQS